MKIKSGLLSYLNPANNISGGFNNLHGLHHLAENYRVTIKERYKVLLHCEPNLRPSDLLRLLGANQIWSI